MKNIFNIILTFFMISVLCTPVLGQEYEFKDSQEAVFDDGAVELSDFSAPIIEDTETEDEEGFFEDTNTLETEKSDYDGIIIEDYEQAGSAEASNKNACGPNLTWEVSGTTLKIKGSGPMYDFSDGWWEYDVPWENYQQSITKIDIGSKVTTISAGAFYEFINLNSVTVEDSVTDIGWAAFKGCSNLVSVKIGGKVSNIHGEAFMDCTNLVKVSLGSSLVTMGEKVFQNCSNLLSITIPDNVAIIPDYAFMGATSLVSVKFGKNTEQIGKSAFALCPDLISVTFNSKLKSIGACAFEECTSLQSLSLPSSVTDVESAAFYKCIGIEEVTIPGGKTLGSSAFASCTNLKSVVLKKVKKIDSSAFANCKALETVEFGNKLETLEYRAFQFCVSLTKADLPSGVKYIGDNCFYNNTSLSSVNLGENLTFIGEYAFYNCTALTSIDIPSGVEKISKGCFGDCTALQKVSIGDKCTIIEAVAFGGCRSLLSVSFGKRINIIGQSAFYGCYSLEQIMLNDNLSEIQMEAFCECSRLSSVIIGSKVEEIGYRAFGECESLTTFTIYSKNTFFRGGSIPSGEQLTIRGYKDSTSEAFAADNENSFVLIEKTPLEQDWFSLEKTSFIWSGEEIMPVIINTHDLYEDMDYRVVYDYDSTGGEHTVEIYGINNYKGMAELNYKIKKANQTITVLPSLKKSAIDEPFNLEAELSFGDGSLKYKSSNTKVAAVDSKGKITVKTAGTVIITVTASETSNCKKATASTNLNIKKAKQKITNVKSSYSVSYRKKSLQLLPKASGKLTFSSGNKSIANVSSSGKVTFKKKGKVKITIKAASNSVYNETTKVITINIKS